jgi:two-component SAPR family response regulator
VGKRILVAEDDYLVALELVDQLRFLGAEVIGPFHDVASARGALPLEQPDIAVLDIKLGTNLVYPLADMLVETGVPFVFTTGFDASALPARYASRPRMMKPITTRHLEAVLSAVLADQATPSNNQPGL